MPRRALESALERRARIYAQTHGGLLIKLQHSVVGLPDRLLVRPGQPAVFIEFKRLRETPTAIQSYWLGRLLQMGQVRHVCDSWAGFLRIWEAVDAINAPEYLSGRGGGGRPRNRRAK